MLTRSNWIYPLAALVAMNPGMLLAADALPPDLSSHLWHLLVPGIGLALLTVVIVVSRLRHQKVVAQLLAAQQQLKVNNHLHHMIFENIKVPILLFDSNGKLLKVNPMACSIVQKEQHEILSRPCFENFCLNSDPPVYCPVLRCLETGESAQVDLNLYSRDFTITAEPIRDESGKIVYVLENAVDMTEWKTNQQRLTHALHSLGQTQREHQMILDNIQIPIFLYDASGNLVRYNRSAESIAAMSVEELREVGCNQAFCHLEDRNQCCPVMRVVQHGMATENRFTIAGRECIVRAEPITDEHGTLVNVVKSVIDVTEIEAGKRQQELALQAARNADRAKSFFIASISHEIRTPLNAIIGFSNLLVDKDLPPEQHLEYLTAIRHSGHSLLHLVNDILDLSLLESGQLPLNPSPCSFAGIWNEIRLIFQSQAERKQLSLEADLPEIPEFIADPQRLRQILWNLVGNAIQFTQKGFVRVEAEFQPESARTGTLLVRVIDTGCGISPEDQQKLFEPFGELSEYRGSRAEHNSTGLGLPVTRRLIHRMGGTIGIESALHAGSTFWFKLPHLATLENGERPRHEPAPSHPGLPPGHEVLVVDDIPLNLKVLEALLRKQAVKPLGARSGQAALELWQQNPCELILTDMWMPEMNGMELAQELRRRAPQRNLQIIAVTADTEVKDNFDMNVFDAVIFKPVTLEKLSEALHKIQEGRK